MIYVLAHIAVGLSMALYYLTKYGETRVSRNEYLFAYFFLWPLLLVGIYILREL